MEPADEWARDAQQRYRTAVAELLAIEPSDENGDVMDPTIPPERPVDAPPLVDDPAARLLAAHEIDRQAQEQQERETAKSQSGSTTPVMNRQDERVQARDVTQTVPPTAATAEALREQTTTAAETTRHDSSPRRDDARMYAGKHDSKK